MLNNRAGCRIAVVVNDMASVNIDAELVRQGGGLVLQEEKMVELQNGVLSRRASALPVRLGLEPREHCVKACVESTTHHL